MMQEIIKIEQGVVRNPQWRMAAPINLTICSGEQIAIVGDNSAGKSRLVEILTQHYPLMPLHEAQYDFSPSPLRLVSENLKYISFRDSYGESDGTYYYQQVGTSMTLTKVPPPWVHCWTRPMRMPAPRWDTSWTRLQWPSCTSDRTFSGSI